MFDVKDDSFGEDRHVMQHHGSGAVLSLLRNVAITLLRRCLLIVVIEGTAHRQSGRDWAFNQLLPYFHLDFGKALDRTGHYE